MRLVTTVSQPRSSRDALNVGGDETSERLLHRIFGRTKIAEDSERQVGEVGSGSNSTPRTPALLRTT